MSVANLIGLIQAVSGEKKPKNLQASFLRRPKDTGPTDLFFCAKRSKMPRGTLPHCYTQCDRIART